MKLNTQNLKKPSIWIIIAVSTILAVNWDKIQYAFENQTLAAQEYPPVSAISRPDTVRTPFVPPPQPAEPEQGPMDEPGKETRFGDWTLSTYPDSAMASTYPVGTQSVILSIYRNANEGCNHFRMVLLTTGDTTNTGMASIKVDGNLKAFVPILGRHDPIKDATPHQFQFGYSSHEINKDMLTAMTQGAEMTIIYISNNQSSHELHFSLKGSYKALYGQQDHCQSLEQAQHLPAPIKLPKAGNGPTL